MRRPGPRSAREDRPREVAEAQGWLRADLRRTPLAVWCLLVLHLLLLLVWTTLQPAYRGLDEVAHVDMVVSLPSVLDWPDPGEKVLSNAVAGTLAEAGQTGPPDRRLTPGEALPRDDRPSFEEAEVDGRGGTVNQMVQHPPLYYAYTSVVLRLWPGAEDWAFDLQLTLVRLLSLVLVAPLPLLAWLAACRLRLSRAAGTAAAVFPLAVPGLTRVGASVSNDTLLILTIGVATVLGLAVAGGDLRRRTAVALGLTAVAGMYSKGLGLVLPVMVGAVYLVAVLSGARLRSALAPAATALGLTVVLGGSWYVSNVVRFGAVQPNGYPGGGLPYPRAQGGGLAEWGRPYVEDMAFRFWSALGQPEPPGLPYDLCVRLTVAGLLVVLVALVVARRRRLLVVSALLPFVGLLMLVAYGSYSNYQTYDRLIGVQGRYLYPAVVGLAAVLALAFDRLSGPARRLLPLVALLFAGWLQWLAFQAVLTVYWTPAGATSALANGFDTLETWAAVPEPVVRALWSGAVLAGVAALVATVVLAVRYPRSDREVREEQMAPRPVTEEPPPAVRDEPAPQR